MATLYGTLATSTTSPKGSGPFLVFREPSVLPPPYLAFFMNPTYADHLNDFGSILCSCRELSVLLPPFLAFLTTPIYADHPHRLGHISWPLSRAFGPTATHLGLLHQPQPRRTPTPRIRASVLVVFGSFQPYCHLSDLPREAVALLMPSADCSHQCFGRPTAALPRLLRQPHLCPPSPRRARTLRRLTSWPSRRAFGPPDDGRRSLLSVLRTPHHRPSWPPLVN